MEQQLQLEVALAAARKAAAEAGNRQEAAHAEAADLRERVQARLGEASTSIWGSIAVLQGLGLPLITFMSPNLGLDGSSSHQAAVMTPWVTL